MTSITESLPAAFEPDLNLAVLAQFVRYAVAALLSATVSAAISLRRSTPIVSDLIRRAVNRERRESCQ